MFRLIPIAFVVAFISQISSATVFHWIEAKKSGWSRVEVGEANGESMRHDGAYDVDLLVHGNSYDYIGGQVYSNPPNMLNARMAHTTWSVVENYWPYFNQFQLVSSMNFDTITKLEDSYSIAQAEFLGRLVFEIDQDCPFEFRTQFIVYAGDYNPDIMSMSIKLVDQNGVEIYNESLGFDVIQGVLAAGRYTIEMRSFASVVSNSSQTDFAGHIDMSARMKIVPAGFPAVTLMLFATIASSRRQRSL